MDFQEIKVFNITLRLSYSKHYFHFHKRLGYDLSLTPNLFVIYYQGQTQLTLNTFFFIHSKKRNCTTTMPNCITVHTANKCPTQNTFFAVYNFSSTSVAILAFNVQQYWKNCGLTERSKLQCQSFECTYIFAVHIFFQVKKGFCSMANIVFD